MGNQIRGGIMVMSADKTKILQRKWVYVTVLWAAILLFTNVSKADFATPFTEINNKVGDISEAHGYVAAKDPNAEDGTYFWVMVMDDCGRRVVINATAKKNVVTRSLLDKEVTIKAKVVSRKKNAKTQKMEIELEILSVRPLEEEKSRDNKGKQ
jgi:hypothetical protein